MVRRGATREKVWSRRQVCANVFVTEGKGVFNGESDICEWWILLGEEMFYASS
jgi:hypothetical protein